MTLPRPRYADQKRFNCEALRGLSGNTKGVAFYIHNALSVAAFHNDKWIAPKQGVIAVELGINRRSVIRAFAILIQRQVFRFQRRYRDTPGGCQDLPYRIAFADSTEEGDFATEARKKPQTVNRSAGRRVAVVSTGVTSTSVTTEQQKKPQKTVDTSVTDLSTYQCDRRVTLDNEVIEAGTGSRPPLGGGGEPVSRAKKVWECRVCKEANWYLAERCFRCRAERPHVDVCAHDADLGDAKQALSRSPRAACERVEMGYEGCEGVAVAFGG